jgi:hypothetical protein
MLNDGTCVVIIERTLYGLMESVKLRYDEFTGFLKNLGFIPNPYDPCGLNLVLRERTRERSAHCALFG